MLGCGIRKCAEKLACHRRAAASFGRRRVASLTRRLRDARKTEVEDAWHTFAIHKHVAWLQVAMNHAASMRVRDRFRDVAKEFNQLTRRLLVAPHKLIEPRALNEFHCEPRFTRSRQPRLIERDDARMPKMRNNFDLALEAKTLLFSSKTPTKQHLHCTRATRRDLLRLVDRALSTAMKFGSKSIASDRTVKLVCRLRLRIATIRLRSRRSRCRDRRNLLKKRSMEKRVVSIKLIDGARAEFARHEMQLKLWIDLDLALAFRQRREFKQIKRKSATTSRIDSTSRHVTAARTYLVIANRFVTLVHASSLALGRPPAPQSPGDSSNSASSRSTISRSFAAMRLFAR